MLKSLFSLCLLGSLHGLEEGRHTYTEESAIQVLLGYLRVGCALAHQRGVCYTPAQPVREGETQRRRAASFDIRGVCCTTVAVQQLLSGRM